MTDAQYYRLCALIRWQKNDSLMALHASGNYDDEKRMKRLLFESRAAAICHSEAAATCERLGM